MVPSDPFQLAQTQQGPDLAIHHPESVIEGMNDWCKEHHGKSGLTQRVRESTISPEEAEKQVSRQLIWNILGSTRSGAL